MARLPGARGPAPDTPHDQRVKGVDIAVVPTPAPTQRQPRRLAGALLSAAGVAGLGLMTTKPRVANAFFSAGAAPDGGDLVNTHLTVQGNLTVQGSRVGVGIAAGSVGGFGDGATTVIHQVHGGAGSYGLSILSTPATGNGATVGVVSFGTTGTGAQGTGEKRAGIIAFLLDADSATNVSGRFVVYTTSGGSIQERLRITSIGNVGIGTPSPVQRLDVAGRVNALSGFNVNNVEAIDGNATAMKSYYAQ